jgi:hypothetical protein
MLMVENIHDVRLQEAIRACGAGSSPWIQLAAYAVNKSLITPAGS